MRSTPDWRIRATSNNCRERSFGRENYAVVVFHHKWCSVCEKSQCSAHEPGQTHIGNVRVMITDAAIHEVSFVARPAHADARIVTIPIDAEEVERSIGRLPKRAYLKCDKCLDGCGGFD